MKTDYTREELLDLCERGIVPEDKWGNRDSESSQRSLGEAWALLKARCMFRVRTKENVKRPDSGCYTDEKCVWIDVVTRGFDCFEGGAHGTHTFYIPTAARLEQAKGGDWY